MNKIGVKVEEFSRESLPEVMESAGMNWQVEQVPLFIGQKVDVWTEDGVQSQFEPTKQQVETHVANRRTDNKDVLAVVGKRYEVFQNHELAELVLAVEGESGAKLDSAGIFGGGKDVFFLLQNGSFKLPGDDVVQTYHFFGNNHAGSRGINVVPTSRRPMCDNILNAVVEKADMRGLRLWHTKNLRTRLSDSLQAIKVSEESANRFQQRCEYLASRVINAAGVREYFTSVYEQQYGPEPKLDEFSPKGDKQRLKRRADAFAAWNANLQKEVERMNGLQITAWNALNAVTEWSDHERRASPGMRSQANLLGASAKFKESAFRMAGRVGV